MIMQNITVKQAIALLVQMPPDAILATWVRGQMEPTPIKRIHLATPDNTWGGLDNTYAILDDPSQ